MTKPLAVVAVGGNALISDDQHMALADQYNAVCATATHVATMIGAGWNVVLTHGNGPQVGFILRRSEIANGQVPTVPVQYAVGDTQGAIGFMFQNALGNALLQRGLKVPVVTLVTQTLVDRQDPAFAMPDKPIGSFMTEEVARRLAAQLGWTVMPDSNRGWRRAIASPQPVRVIEAPIIERLAREGVLIIACGGGGIAVEQLPDGELRGLEAVIDKDRASALLAIEMGADLLMIPTGVPRVAIRFGQPDQEWLDRITVAQAEAYAAEGHFGAGSMGPKIEALLKFVKGRAGGRGVITNAENIERALRGETGTWIESQKNESRTTMETTLLAVNGTLMRGLELNPNLLAVGATFVREDETAACYRIWSIGDRHPAMQRVPSGGVRVALELWAVPLAGLASILQNEPPGLAIGKVVLKDGSIVLGVLGEPFLCEGQREITAFGGWRAYTAAQH